MLPVKISDYRILAKKKLTDKIFDFIDGGACDEITKKRNRKAFDDLNLRPLHLRNVSKIDTSLKLFGCLFSSPFMIAPMAFHQLVHKKGEVATARASKACGIPMVVSTMSNCSLEDVASHSESDKLWFQLYMFSNKKITESLVRRAEKAGYKAMVVTIDAPVMGKRDRDVKSQFSLPSHLAVGNFESASKDINNKAIYNFASAENGSSLTWDDIDWIASITKLPIIIKGIINPLNAKEACEHNVAGIIVSNHGGRQLDTTESTLNMLPEIVKIVSGRMPVMLDGAIQRGTDIVKAIALGADAVLLGRPVLWALALRGEKGVVQLLKTLKEEFDIAMKLCGCRTLTEIRKQSKHLISSRPCCERYSAMTLL